MEGQSSLQHSTSTQSKEALAPRPENERPTSSCSSQASDFSFAQPSAAAHKDTPLRATRPKPSTLPHTSVSNIAKNAVPQPLGEHNTPGLSRAPFSSNPCASRPFPDQNTPPMTPLNGLALPFYPYSPHLPQYRPSAEHMPPYMTPSQVPLPYTPRPGQYAPPGMVTPMPDAYTTKPMHYYGYPGQPISPYHFGMPPPVISYPYPGPYAGCSSSSSTPSPNSCNTIHSNGSRWSYSTANPRTPPSTGRSAYTAPYSRRFSDTPPSTGNRSRARSFRSQESFWPSRSSSVSLADTTNTWMRKEPLHLSPLREEERPHCKTSIRRLTSYCFQAHSKGIPANLPKKAIKTLVKHQLEAQEPVVAPWYRPAHKEDVEGDLEDTTIDNKENCVGLTSLTLPGTGVFLPRV